MLLGYAARNAIHSVKPEHVQQFRDLAMKQGQDLSKAVPGYHNIARGIADKIQTLDEGRRAAAHQDLGSSLLPHVATALAAQKAAPAIAAIVPHIRRLAQQHGVPMGAPAVPGA